MIEAITAVALVTIACSAMLVSVGHTLQTSESSQGTSRANALALDLMHEISACQWSDPQTPQHWGPEPDEVHGGLRSAFDDLDDYDQWSGPPQTKAGNLYDTLQQKLFPGSPSSHYAQYTCSVAVKYVTSTGQLLQATSNTSPYRQVTIEITHPQYPPVTLSRIFASIAPLLGRATWYDPKAVESDAIVTVISSVIDTTTSGAGDTLPVINQTIDRLQIGP